MEIIIGLLIVVVVIEVIALILNIIATIRTTEIHQKFSDVYTALIASHEAQRDLFIAQKNHLVNIYATANNPTTDKESK